MSESPGGVPHPVPDCWTVGDLLEFCRGLPPGLPLRVATPELPTGEYLLTGFCFDPDPSGEGMAPWATLLTSWPPRSYTPPEPPR